MKAHEFERAGEEQLKRLIALSNSTSEYVYRFRLPIIKALLSRGYRVCVVAPPDDYTELLKEQGCEFLPFALDNKGVNPFREAGTIFRYYKTYKSLQPDVILQYTSKPNIYGSIAARWLNLPCINNIAGLGTAFVNNNILTLIVKFLYRFSLRSAYKVFFQNRDDMELFKELSIVDTRQAGLLPGSGIDLDAFSPSYIPHERSSTVFVLIARVMWEKGIREFAEAARILKMHGCNIECILIGQVDEEDPRAVPVDTIREWEHQGLLQWMGKQQDVRRYVQEADCVVLPSYREGTPRTLLEAASMGKPIIAADSIGTREPVEDGVNGYLCRKKSAEDLAYKMRKIVEMDHSERKRMGVRGREKMEREYDVEIVVEHYMHVIGQLMHENSMENTV